ncbi:MAG TPA: peptide chain release factor 3, partial [Phytomonospora sp.]
RGDATPVLAAVGTMQFEVATHRLTEEFGVPTTLDYLPYELARRTDADSAEKMKRAPGTETFVRARDGVVLAAFLNKWRMQTVKTDYPGITLEPLLADADA